MTQRRTSRTAVLGLAICAAAVAGCGAGQVTQTSTQEAAVNGAMAETGELRVRDAEIAYPEEPDNAGASVYPAGSDAEVTMMISNQGITADELVGARSDGAQQVRIEGDRVIPGDNALRIAPQPSPVEALQHAEMTLQGLTRQLRPGLTIKVTLDFRKAESVTVDLPVAAPGAPREDHDQGEQDH